MTLSNVGSLCLSFSCLASCAWDCVTVNLVIAEGEMGVESMINKLNVRMEPGLETCHSSHTEIALSITSHHTAGKLFTCQRIFICQMVTAHHKLFHLHCNLWGSYRLAWSVGNHSLWWASPTSPHSLAHSLAHPSQPRPPLTVSPTAAILCTIPGQSWLVNDEQQNWPGPSLLPKSVNLFRLIFSFNNLLFSWMWIWECC